jgi:pSer/pThr/pTyr-binding forkhead associated (FHA) protein
MDACDQMVPRAATHTLTTAGTHATQAARVPDEDQEPAEKVAYVEFVQRWIVGTHEDCEVRVADQYVSPRHCEVVLRADDHYMVRDLGSTNGTYVRERWGQRVVERRVRDWSLIKPGETLVVGRSHIPWAQKGET